LKPSPADIVSQIDHPENELACVAFAHKFISQFGSYDFQAAVRGKKKIGKTYSRSEVLSVLSLAAVSIQAHVQNPRKGFTMAQEK